MFLCYFLSYLTRIGVMFFFFLAEDGIRVGTVTGVQTCALPISILRCGATLEQLEEIFQDMQAGLPEDEIATLLKQSVNYSKTIQQAVPAEEALRRRELREAA